MEEEALLGSTPELGATINAQGLATLGIVAIGGYVLYKIGATLAKKGGLA